MEYQQLVSPSVTVVQHGPHHPQPTTQPQSQQQPHHQPQNQSQVVPPSHPHIVLAPAHQPQPQPPPNLPPPTTHAHQLHPPLPPIHDDSTSSRWTQYQHIWRQHHVYINGEVYVMIWFINLGSCYHQFLKVLNDMLANSFCNRHICLGQWKIFGFTSLDLRLWIKGVE